MIHEKAASFSAASTFFTISKKQTDYKKTRLLLHINKRGGIKDLPWYCK
ncbi:hypothetical protein LLB_1348 [Legionella longbeachae D-4968]|nr:hypothetical protein LLB_1348 [Legionella longbeachae D-4968]